MDPIGLFPNARLTRHTRIAVAAVIATMAMAVVAATTAPAGAATPRCNGLVATIVRGAGPDNVTGTPGNDVIVAGAGNDTVDGAGGHDTICGGDGRDTLMGGPGNDSLFGGGGADTLRGGGGTDPNAVWGTDWLYGEGGNDKLFGGPGDNVLDGGPGNDRMQATDGQVSRGTLSYEKAPNAVKVDLAAGTATGWGNDTIVLTTTSTGIRNVRGGRFADTLTGDDLPNQLYGGPAGASASQDRDTLNGKGGDDLLYGGIGNDRLNGGIGNDRLVPGPGNDRAAGGGLTGGTITGGVDTLDYSAAPAVKVNISAGTATGEGNDTFTDIEVFLGSSQADDIRGVSPLGRSIDIYGNAGNDRLGGGAGPVGWTRVYGGPGNDTITDAGRAWGEDGDDVMHGDAAGNGLFGGPGDDEIHGGGGADAIGGDSGRDTLTGDEGDDQMYGNDGDDSIGGNAGNDFANGGPGTDTCEVESATDCEA